MPQLKVRPSENDPLDAISKKLFENLEDQWEMTQAYEELESLQQKNNEKFERYQQQLRSTSKPVEKQSLMKSISNMKLVMSSNEEIKQEMIS